MSLGQIGLYIQQDPEISLQIHYHCSPVVESHVCKTLAYISCTEKK